MRTNDTLHAIWNAFCAASGKREEDPLSVMWRAYLDGKSKTQSGENLRLMLISIFNELCICTVAYSLKQVY
jgi:hypothetical protein